MKTRKNYISTYNKNNNRKQRNVYISTEIYINNSKSVINLTIFIKINIILTAIQQVILLSALESLKMINTRNIQILKLFSFFAHMGLKNIGNRST